MTNEENKKYFMGCKVSKSDNFMLLYAQNQYHYRKIHNLRGYDSQPMNSLIPPPHLNSHNFRLIFQMEHNCRDRISFILFSLVFIISATYRTILFGESFHEPFDKHVREHIGEFHEEHNLMKVEANWNWTLFAKKGF